MRAYLECAKKSFQELLAYRGELLTRVLGMFFTFYLLYMFWRGLYVNSTEVQGISFDSMLTYTMISAIIGGGLLRNMGVLQVTVIYWVTTNMRSGGIISYLLRPINFQLYLFSLSLGNFFFNLIFSIPVVISTFLIFRLDPPYSQKGLILFAVSLGLSYLINFLLDFTVSLIAFWTTEIGGIGGFTRLIISIFSGSFIPLWFMPEWARDLLSYLPFASIFHAPLSIYIGRIRGGEALNTIFIQIIWVAILFIGSHLLWLRARRKLMVQGG